MQDQIYQELNSKTDLLIHNRVKKNPFKDETYNAIAKQIYDERDLDSIAKQELIENYPTYLSKIRTMLESGKKKSELVDYLTEKSVPRDQAINVINERFEQYKNSLKVEKEAKVPWLLIIGIILLIVKWVLRSRS